MRRSQRSLIVAKIEARKLAETTAEAHIEAVERWPAVINLLVSTRMKEENRD